MFEDNNDDVSWDNIRESMQHENPGVNNQSDDEEEENVIFKKTSKKTYEIAPLSDNCSFGNLQNVIFDDKKDYVIMRGEFNNENTYDMISNEVYKFLEDFDIELTKKGMKELKKLYRKYNQTIDGKGLGNKSPRGREPDDEEINYMSPRAADTIYNNIQEESLYKPSKIRRYQPDTPLILDGQTELMTYLEEWGLGNRNTLQPILSTIKQLYDSRQITREEILRIKYQYNLP